MMLVPVNRNRNMFNEMMSNPFEAFFDSPASNSRPSNGLMKTDVKETDQGFDLAVELPGAKKEDVSADIKDGYLTIKATTSTSNEEKDDNGAFIRKERFEGSCSRSFYVGEDIDDDSIKATFEDGVLHIAIPKKEQPKIEEGKSISIG